MRGWRRLLLALLLLAAAALATAREADGDQQTRMRSSATRSKSGSKSESKSESTSEQPHRIVAVGDLHGDYANAVRVLRMAGVVDEDAKWAGGSKLTFVQTGDVVDRGPDTIALYAMLQRLAEEASEAGGRVVALLGNHESMNLYQDTRYVTEEDVASFGSMKKRKKAFLKTGFIGSYLTGLDMVQMVNRTVFVHGGIHPDYAREGIQELNRRVHEAFAGYLDGAPRQLREIDIFVDANSPTWYRGFALEKEKKICPLLTEALALLKAERMVVGHTVQDYGRITSRCDNKFFLIDVGISAVYGGYAAALEIVGDKVRAIYPDGVVDMT